MVSSGYEPQQSSDRTGRAGGDRRRRRALADAAAGIVPDVPQVSEGYGRIERFRCVIYVCGAPQADIAGPRQECAEYAEAFGWEVTEVIEERAGLLPPQGRDGLERALGRVRRGEAGAVLTACRSMISSVRQEYEELVGEIEKAGGFLHVAGGPRAERPMT
ncbi:MULTISPECIES: hypothetical protein [Streptomyces]|uniref:hypothetical protein n=1 Tax=Streptomyces TaxID=1883 RepID=UPI001E398C7C|nr:MULTISPECIES: hypothetical protein [Streptomyces]UFQ16287.1 hypothetical protein J2N69_15495 [Streptomyces huasconensis]WCL85891.1 hypothetical protein PPN52_15505 [Streptomyces sp. JCM 35825]